MQQWWELLRCDSWNTLWFIKDILSAPDGKMIPNQTAAALVCPPNPHQQNHRTSVVSRAHGTISISMFLPCSVQIPDTAMEGVFWIPESRWHSVKFSGTFVMAGLGLHQRNTTGFYATTWVFNLMRQILFKVSVIRGNNHWLQLMAIWLGKHTFMHYTGSFGFSKSWYNEPEYSPPQLTHRKKVNRWGWVRHN